MAARGVIRSFCTFCLTFFNEYLQIDLLFCYCLAFFLICLKEVCDLTSGKQLHQFQNICLSDTDFNTETLHDPLLPPQAFQSRFLQSH